MTFRGATIFTRGKVFPDCDGSLKFFEQGASLQTENLWVKCAGCDVPARSLVHAFGREAEKNLPACRGRHPHLNTFEEDCQERPRAVLLGSTNSWFSISLSVLAIPQGKDQFGQLIEDGWTYFSDVESEAETRTVLKTLAKSARFRALMRSHRSRYGRLSRRSAPERTRWPRRKLTSSDRSGGVRPIPPRRMTGPSSPRRGGSREVSGFVADVLLLQRLREVNALVGFTRVEAPEESDDPEDRPPMASLLFVVEAHFAGARVRCPRRRHFHRALRRRT